MRSALLAADIVLIPAQPSPFDGWASGEMLKLIDEARIFRPQLIARFVLNRSGARTLIARDTAELLADHDPPALGATVGQRVSFADAARSGRLVSELDRGGAGGARNRRARRRNRRDRAMSRERKTAFVGRPSDAEAWVRAPEAEPPRDADASRCTARLTIDITPEQRGRIKVTAFKRGLTVADMLRDLLAREFPDSNGDAV